MKIFLVRHGQSQSNVDWDKNRHVADHAIELTEVGKEQARACGKFLAKYFEENIVIKNQYVDFDPDDPEGYGWAPRLLPRTRLWLSPYTRTRQTADEISTTAVFDDQFVSACRAWTEVEGDWRNNWRNVQQMEAKSTFLYDRKEHMLLAEQQFGVFDGLSDAEREQKYPDFHAYYEKCKQFEGKLWPKMPLGESRFEVCQRVHQAFGTFQRDLQRHGVENLVIVAHGTVNRAFIMMWLHLPYEWMHQEPNPKNASVRLLEDGEDRGYIFEGFDHAEGYVHGTTKETEE